jgi:phenylacetate-coenzyme A ligase PaaK-like adenylate-forming protein
MGTPALMVTTASGGVRTCMAAMERGLDIEGTLFSLTGEPYTAAKAAVIEEAGATGASQYAMAEAGAIGMACAAGDAYDDVHLLGDKVATIQRPTRVGDNGATVDALVHTTLLASSPKLMLNVDSGDYAVMEERDCGCGAFPAPFRTHLHTIRSHEKLTSEGMSFLGSDLITLLEEVLPTRFGGRPTDYQLLEREEGGLTRASLVVRGDVGEIDRDEVAGLTLDFLRSRGQPERLMAEIWDQGQTLEVIRDEPRLTPGSKIMPLQPMVD